MVRTLVDCSQSPHFSVGLWRLVCFDGAVDILVCKGERDLGRVSGLPRGVERGLVELDTLPRLHSPVQTKMATARSKLTSLDNPMEKLGGWEQSRACAK